MGKKHYGRISVYSMVDLVIEFLHQNKGKKGLPKNFPNCPEIRKPNLSFNFTEAETDRAMNSLIKSESQVLQNLWLK